MKVQVLSIIVILALLVAGALFYSQQYLSQEVPSIPGATGQNLYASGVYGMTFTYPDYYTLTEHDDGARHTITLIHARESQLPEAGEGPPAITVDVYDNSSDALTIEDWLATGQSNFNLGDKVLGATNVGGVQAVTYRWSGLYEGETTAFVRGDMIVAVSVTYLAPTDQLRADYLALLVSLTLN